MDPEVTLRIRPIQRAADSPPKKEESEESDSSQASEEGSEADAEERKSADEELLGAIGGWNPFQREEEKENEAPPAGGNPWAMNWWPQEEGKQPPPGYVNWPMPPREENQNGGPGSGPTRGIHPTPRRSPTVPSGSGGKVPRNSGTGKDGEASGDAGQV